MSLAEFQRAFADLIRSPATCAAARHDPESFLAPYVLEPRERARLAKLVDDAGMSINCTLFRVNRLTPLLSVLPLACAWLGDRLRGELELYWESTHLDSLAFGPESERFAAWLEQRVNDGLLARGPWLDALRYELAAFATMTASESGAPACDVDRARRRVVTFVYDPRAVLAGPRGESLLRVAPSRVVVDASSGVLDVSCSAVPEPSIRPGAG